MSKQSELVIDQKLINELRNPESDQRNGVNVIARPSVAIRDRIFSIQNGLRIVEPDQYYYPSFDLHLTVLEICSGTESSQANQIFEQLSHLVPGIFQELTSPRIEQPSLRFDNQAGVVVFQQVGALNEVRQELSQRLVNHGINVAPRYATCSAHITFMRYLKQLSGNSAQLETAAQILGAWQLDEFWLTCGSNWYGMNSRIKEVGPFKIGNASPDGILECDLRHCARCVGWRQYGVGGLPPCTEYGAGSRPTSHAAQRIALLLGRRTDRSRCLSQARRTASETRLVSRS